MYSARRRKKKHPVIGIALESFGRLPIRKKFAYFIIPAILIIVLIVLLCSNMYRASSLAANSSRESSDDFPSGDVQTDPYLIFSTAALNITLDDFLVRYNSIINTLSDINTLGLTENNNVSTSDFGTSGKSKLSIYSLGSIDSFLFTFVVYFDPVTNNVQKITIMKSSFDTDDDHNTLFSCVMYVANCAILRQDIPDSFQSLYDFNVPLFDGILQNDGCLFNGILFNMSASDTDNVYTILPADTSVLNQISAQRIVTYNANNEEQISAVL